MLYNLRGSFFIFEFASELFYEVIVHSPGKMVSFALSRGLEGDTIEFHHA